MLFTELNFWYLFAAVLLLLLANRVWLRNVTLQNGILLVASYIFYGAWDYRFLFLIALVSAQTYILGSLIIRDPDGPWARHLTALSVIINLGVLGVFKYLGFFLDSLGALNLPLNTWLTSLEIILPVGISFYIFQTLTFVIDAHRKEIRTIPSVLNYFTYIAFFPQLVAGPIERARRLLPQFEDLRPMSWAALHSGTRMIVFGLFLKVVIADQLAPAADAIFVNHATLDGGTLALGLVYFSAQIYGDFCGYSTIAIGVARCMGFELSVNFAAPFWVRSLTSHWRHWHISLSSFFRDYVYIPLGGSRGSVLRVAIVTVTTFWLSGLWHGAGWGFVLWGILHGSVVAFERIAFLASTGLRAATPHLIRKAGILLGWLWALFWIAMSWPFFRMDRLDDTMTYFQRMFGDFGMPETFRSVVLILPLVAFVDWMWWRDPKLDQGTSIRNPVAEDLVLGIMLAVSVSYLVFALSKQPFIYFQF